MRMRLPPGCWPLGGWVVPVQLLLMCLLAAGHPQVVLQRLHCHQLGCLELVGQAIVTAVLLPVQCCCPGGASHSCLLSCHHPPHHLYCWQHVPLQARPQHGPTQGDPLSARQWQVVVQELQRWTVLRCNLPGVVLICVTGPR
jgi:hypothetical protein